MSGVGNFCHRWTEMKHRKAMVEFGLEEEKPFFHMETTGADY